MSVNLRSDKQERDYQMAKKTNRQSIRKPPAILPRIVILLFLLMMLLFMNLDSVSHLLNYGSYEKVTAKVVRPNHCLIKVNFFRNPVNWLLLALIALCITDMIRRIKKKQTYRTQKGGLDT